MTGILFCSYIGGTLLCEANSSNSEAMPSYILEDIVVTATRTETKDLDTPATTVVITRKQLEEQGENSLFEAISKVVGITAWSFGTGGGGLCRQSN